MRQYLIHIYSVKKEKEKRILLFNIVHASTCKKEIGWVYSEHTYTHKIKKKILKIEQNLMQ